MTPAAEAQAWLQTATLEEILTSPFFFGLTTASPVQRAFCRVVDGVELGDLEDDPTVRRAFGEALPAPVVRKENTWLSAIRAAKSLVAAAFCIRCSQRVQIPDFVGPGEVLRIPVLSLDKDKARAVLNHLVGRVNASAMLRMLVVRTTAEGLVLRHPSGRHVEALVVAGKRGGAASVAYWLAGAVFDEFPKMSGADEAVVNWDETRAAAYGRILPGGAILNIGSPWAPEGPAYNQVTTHFGKPTDDLVVAWSNGADTNPVWWTPENIAADARTNPNHRTDCLAQFATPESAFFSVDLLVAREGALPRAPGASYAAFIDPATRGNAFTLIVVTRDGRRLVVAAAHEWVGSKDAPLDTGVVLTEIRDICASYGVTVAVTDQYMGDALQSQARERSFSLTQWNLTEPEKLQRALAFRTKLAQNEIELCDVATWKAGVTTRTQNLVLDVQRVKRLTTQSSAVVKLPLTTDGRHCDFWPPLGMAMGAYLADVQAPNEENTEAARMRAAAIRKYGPKGDEDDYADE